MSRTTLLLSLVMLAATGCAPSAPPPQSAAPAAPATPAATATDAPAAPAPSAYTLEAPTTGTTIITAADGGAALTILIDGGKVEVSTAGGERYVGNADGEKRRYRRASNGEAAFEVKSSDKGFKLRAPDDKLLWKVKIDDDKIKVSDNEENKSPWVLKTKYEDKVKVLDPGEQEIGEVKFYADKVKVKDAGGTDRHTIDGGRRSAAFGVMLMSGVPADQRGIIAAELLVRGR